MTDGADAGPSVAIDVDLTKVFALMHLDTEML